MRYANLVGNGLSIAYKDDLAIGPPTTALLERFKNRAESFRLLQRMLISS